jgi:hypothetical protein
LNKAVNKDSYHLSGTEPLLTVSPRVFPAPEVFGVLETWSLFQEQEEVGKGREGSQG